MELISVRDEPAASERVRRTALVAYDDRATEEYWFEFPAELAGDLSASGNPWLICLAPLAASLKEPLRIALPIDPLLARNVRELMAVWSFWAPGVATVPIEAETRTAPSPTGTRRTGLFFSGGVDSFFSLYRNDLDDAGSVPVDDLIAVHGFDILIQKGEAFERHVARLRAAAEDRGKTLIPVRTNLRNTRLREAPWGRLWHGCAMASVGLMLESRFEALLVSSTNHYSALEPWGSHPLTDPLFSTEHTRFLHDGAGFRRWEKLEFLSRFDVVLQTLHVCYRDGSDANCGECEKCVRNMTILEVLGVLGRCETFPSRTLDLDKLSRVLIDQGWRPEFYDRLRDFAASRDRFDVVDAIDRSFRRSRFRRPAVRIAERLSRRPFAGRLARPLGRWALAGSVH